MENKSYAIFFLLLIVVTTYCNENSVKQSNDEAVDCIVLDAVDLRISTVIQIDCDKFEASFSSSIVKKEIKNQLIIDYIVSNLDKQMNLKLKGSSVDTRAKLKLFTHGTQNKPDREFCIGLHTFSSNGECYKMSSDLRKIIMQSTQ